MKKVILTAAATLIVAGMANAAVIIDATTNNGSFESPINLGGGGENAVRVDGNTGWTKVASGWSMYTNVGYIPKGVTDGDWSLTANDGVTTTVTTDPIAYAISAGDELTLTFDMGTNSDQAGGGVLSDNFTGNIYFDGGAAVTFGTQQVTSTVDLGSGLYRNIYSSTIIAPAGASSIVFDLVMQNSDTGNSQAYVDNINLSVVPEPATLGLLGLAFGGLVALRRRKK